MLLTLTIKQVADALDGVCRRTAIKFCRDNGIKIYPKDKGPRQWVYAAEFYKTLHAGLFPDLIKKFGDKAVDAYHAYRNNDPLKLAMLEQEIMSTQKGHKTYLSGGKIASSFLERINNKSFVKPNS